MRMAKPWEVLYTEWHRYPRSRRTGGKEKLEEENRNLREEMKYIRKLNTYDYNELQDLVITLEEENKKLKSDLSECECSMHFENDEVWYRKRECKKLKAELSKYKKLHKYSNWELLTYKGGELMEEDTLQELRDIGEI